MNNLFENFGTWIIQNPTWANIFISIGIIVQGEITILISFYLILARQLNFFQFIFYAPITLICWETFVYSIGRILRNTRLGWKIYKKIKNKKQIQIYNYFIRENKIKIFITAKFIPGLNFLSLIITGWTKIKFGEFLKSYLPSVFIWFSSISIIAYFIASTTRYLSRTYIFKNTEFIVLGVILVIFFVERIITKKIKNSIFKKTFKKIEQEKSGAAGGN